MDDVPPPETGPGQVRLAVVAAGVNPVECRIRRGEVPEALVGAAPWGLGTDVAGVVDAVGAGPRSFAVGDAVFGRALGGAYAEYACADPADLLPKPADLPWDVAASVAITGETAYRTLGLLGVTGLGGTLLVHGASGGVGALAVQLAVIGGARVLGTAGPASLGRVRALGAEPVVYGPGWVGRVRALAPEGVDAVLDTAGTDVLGESVKLAGGPERVVTIADRLHAAEHGVTYSRGLVARVPMVEVFAEMLPALVGGRVVVHVAHLLPLAEAPQAHRISEAGHPGGRIVLTGALLKRRDPEDGEHPGEEAVVADQHHQLEERLLAQLPLGLGVTGVVQVAVGEQRQRRAGDDGLGSGQRGPVTGEGRDLGVGQPGPPPVHDVRGPLVRAAAAVGDEQGRDLARPVGQPRAVAQRRAQSLQRIADRGAQQHRAERATQCAGRVRQVTGARSRAADHRVVHPPLLRRQRVGRRRREARPARKGVALTAHRWGRGRRRREPVARPRRSTPDA